VSPGPDGVWTPSNPTTSSCSRWRVHRDLLENWIDYKREKELEAVQLRPASVRGSSCITTFDQLGPTVAQAHFVLAVCRLGRVGWGPLDGLNHLDSSDLPSCMASSWPHSPGGTIPVKAATFALSPCGRSWSAKRLCGH